MLYCILLEIKSMKKRFLKVLLFCAIALLASLIYLFIANGFGANLDFHDWIFSFSFLPFIYIISTVFLFRAYVNLLFLIPFLNFLISTIIFFRKDSRIISVYYCLSIIIMFVTLVYSYRVAWQYTV